jgi:hypothetical protein
VILLVAVAVAVAAQVTTPLDLEFHPLAEVAEVVVLILVCRANQGFQQTLVQLVNPEH